MCFISYGTFTVTVTVTVTVTFSLNNEYKKMKICEMFLLQKEASHTAMETEIRRLQLLENAVLNYGGGLDTLFLRTSSHKSTCPETASILCDMSSYLRDIRKHTRIL